MSGYRGAAVLVRGLLLLLAVTAGLTTSGGALANSRAVKAFPWSTETFHQSIASNDYRVFLSAVNQIDGELRADRTVRLSVKGEAVGTLIHGGYGPERVMQFYRDQVKALGGQVLFSCDGLDCGSSSLWANQIFDHASYFCPDDQQHYLVAKWPGPDKERQLGLFYVVRRGDQEVRSLRLLLTLEGKQTILDMPAGGDRVIGPVIIPWEPGIAIKLETDAESIRRLQKLADRYPKADFVISSFSTLGDQTLSKRMALARRAGKVASEQLQRWGVDRKRITLITAGPGVIVDRQEPAGNRVEIVVIKQGGNSQ